ncbi:MAG: cell wall metabolism sensor histidine kinase WalK [Candidatus Cloacimonetes bacterium]|nr:cell wall metabolism sensor histidine kinase WalK [Candidatus Cloacimonadota bacterium]MCF7815347.1 cell wall metabolism sensor histidine kinase WalK [Candidatus Cloacimonadota bacterium]MCF7869438.1 cell wall metabolism sensor histidine kinase WalK [Candidatus Cloacimonadota bacterium]MCF7884788.1 cell wall metabolism sensor histidine kinase WalK [Candidatus Cloacimonadota bacterium]
MNIFRRVFKNLAIIFASFTVFILLIDSYQLDILTFFIITLLASIICVLIIYFYLRSILKPVEKITSQIAKITKNEAEELSEITRQEFAETFRNLNILLERLQKYEEKLSKQKEGFNTIIESIKEAIWIQNKKGFITISNQSFNDLVDQQQVKDQYFWNVIRLKELYEVADRIFKNPDSITEDINLEDKHYLCSTSYSALTEETVFILYDITEIRKLETIKKDFILNVSHELRTPLTSIKGYLETFEEELSQEQQNYIIVIKRNTDRLIRIVNDLLTLSRLEHDRSIELENIVIEDMLQNLKHIFEHRINSKKLKFITSVQTEKSYFQADRFKIEQVLINLIDNAIKYTEEGEVKIEVLEDKSDFILKISDSGMGIEEKHLSRLFERFYVVDKSRSRHMGGTGLGLSIVKHIINLHKGEIEVESVKGEGTTFVITIPKII